MTGHFIFPLIFQTSDIDGDGEEEYQDYRNVEMMFMDDFHSRGEFGVLYSLFASKRK